MIKFCSRLSWYIDLVIEFTLPLDRWSKSSTNRILSHLYRRRGLTTKTITDSRSIGSTWFLVVLQSGRARALSPKRGNFITCPIDPDVKRAAKLAVVFAAVVCRANNPYHVTPTIILSEQGLSCFKRMHPLPYKITIPTISTFQREQACEFA